MVVKVKNIKKSIVELVGNTPLLQLSNYEKKEQLQANLYAKLDYYNPAQSSKDRVALAMIEQAEREGKLTEQAKIIETTSGNTGIGISAIAAAKCLQAKIYIQDNVSIERRQAIEAYGSEVVSFLSVPEIADNIEEIDGDFVGAVKIFKEVVERDPNNVFLNQIDNPYNVLAHYETTGPEIWRDVAGEIDIFIATVGTGGTISGIGRYLKEQNEAIQIIAVEPAWESVATLEHPEIEEITGIHRFSDVDKERVPENVHLQYIDAIFEVTTDVAKKYAQTIAKTDGVLAGISSGAALAVAHQLALQEENKGKQIVVFFPDTGLRYLSTNLFAQEE